MMGAALGLLVPWKTHDIDDDFDSGERSTAAPVAFEATPLPTPGVGSYASSARMGPVDVYGRLAVQGVHVVGEKTGLPVQLTGMSLSNTAGSGEKFYNENLVKTLYEDWNCTIVRAAMGVDDPGGYADDPTGNVERVRVVVEAAMAIGIYVIVDFHSHEAEASEDEARNFFAAMVDDYGGYEGLIFEIYNEPIDSSWSQAIKPYAQRMLADVIRVGSPNLVVVGTRHYSHEVVEAAADPINDTNVAYAAHFRAATDKQELRDKIDDALALGAAVFISEWGTVEASGGGSVDSSSVSEWMQFAADRSISHLNWSLNDDDESASALVVGASSTGDWDDNDISASGRVVRGILDEAEARRRAAWTTPVALYGALTVDPVMQTLVSNATGAFIQLRGTSFFSSNDGLGGDVFYTAGAVNTLANDWGVDVVRCAMGVEEPGGYVDSPITNFERVRVVVDAAIRAGVYAIVDFHTHHAEDHVDIAREFFGALADLYCSNPAVIFEIYDEPLDVSWVDTIEPYADEIVGLLRGRGCSNLVLVGTPNLSQDVDEASRSPLSHSNIAYVLHFYAGTHGSALRDKALTALTAGLTLFVSEWGTVEAGGDGPVAHYSTGLWMDFLDARYISHCNWAITDRPENASALVPGAAQDGAWADADITVSGRLVRSILATAVS